MAAELGLQYVGSAIHCTEHTESSRGGAWTLAQLELGAVWFLAFESPDLETSGGPQQGGDTDIGQRALLFCGGESEGWFTPGGA